MVHAPLQARPRELLAALDDAVELLADFDGSEQQSALLDQSPSSLLDQCLRLCAEYGDAPVEPVRTLHHFACTGGTVVSKCLAAMPNVQLLSEIDPLSTIAHRADHPRFAPTDLIQLMRQSTKGADPDLITELFLGSLKAIHRVSSRKGHRLVLRDHSHSHFCTGAKIAQRPTLRGLVSSSFPTLSVVTVRHPLDSFLSLKANRWEHFTPFRFDEYCRRYLAFLDAYSGLPVFRYEDFTSAPEQVMQDVCDALQISYSADFVHLFNVFRITGDSGRKADVIGRRDRRPVQEQVLAEMEGAAHWPELRERMGYDT